MIKDLEMMRLTWIRQRDPIQSLKSEVLKSKESFPSQEMRGDARGRCREKDSIAGCNDGRRGHKSRNVVLLKVGETKEEDPQLETPGKNASLSTP